MTGLPRGQQTRPAAPADQRCEGRRYPAISSPAPARCWSGFAFASLCVGLPDNEIAPFPVSTEDFALNVSRRTQRLHPFTRLARVCWPMCRRPAGSNQSICRLANRTSDAPVHPRRDWSKHRRTGAISHDQACWHCARPSPTGSKRRFHLPALDAETQVLPVLGTKKHSRSPKPSSTRRASDRRYWSRIRSTWSRRRRPALRGKALFRQFRRAPANTRGDAVPRNRYGRMSNC